MRRVIVIPKSDREAENAFCNSIGAEGETFRVELYSGGNHTHYICNWNVSEAQAAEIDGYFTNVFETAEDALQAMSLTFPVLDGD